MLIKTLLIANLISFIECKLKVGSYIIQYGQEKNINIAVPKDDTKNYAKLNKEANFPKERTIWDIQTFSQDSFTIFNKATKKYIVKENFEPFSSPELSSKKPIFGWLITSNTNVYYNISSENSDGEYIQRNDSAESGLIFQPQHSGLGEIKWNFIKV